MKIALLRHFKVRHHPPSWCDADRYDQLMKEYDQSAIIPDEGAAIPSEYTICYCSPLPRALETARLLFNGEPVIVPELEEIPLRAIFKTRLRLPFHIWHGLNRIGWMFNSRRVSETRSQTEQRARRFIERILENDQSHILVVSHGLFMANLQEIILRKGFAGPRFFRAEHGRLYEYQKNGDGRRES